MNFDKPTDEQLGLKKEGAKGIDVESVEMAPDLEEIMKRVSIQHPEIVLEIALSGRDIKRGDLYEASLRDDPEALQVWQAIKEYGEDHAEALEAWLDSYAELNTLPIDGDDGEALSQEDYERVYVIPRIQRMLQEKPIALTDFLRAVKIHKLDLDAIPDPTSEQQAASWEKIQQRIHGEQDALQGAEDAIQKAGDEAQAEELTAQAKADEILKKIQGM